MMTKGMVAPINTKMVDVSHLLENYTSQLWVKREDLQITGSHKYRLVHGMVKDALSGSLVDDISVFVEASSGNTGLAVSLIAKQLGKEAYIIAPSNIDPEIGKAIIRNGSVLACQDGIDNCITLAKEYRDTYGYTLLNQYDNQSAVYGFEDMAIEMKSYVGNDVTTIVMGVGTGATISGLATMFPEARVIGCSCLDSHFTIPGWKNFRVNKPGQIIVNNRNYIDSWELIPIDEIMSKQDYFEEALGFRPNLSTVGNLLIAVREGDRINNSMVVTVCTGVDK